MIQAIMSSPENLGLNFQAFLATTEVVLITAMVLQEKFISICSSNSWFSWIHIVYINLPKSKQRKRKKNYSKRGLSRLRSEALQEVIISSGSFIATF